jgi:hypothetical protein
MEPHCHMIFLQVDQQLGNLLLGWAFGVTLELDCHFGNPDLFHVVISVDVVFSAFLIISLDESDTSL